MMLHSMGASRNSQNNIKLFELPWSKRTVKYNRQVLENVQESYKYVQTYNNTGIAIEDGNTTQALAFAYGNASCGHVVFNGGEWTPESVSPLCNCLTNLHTTFAAQMHMFYNYEDHKKKLRTAFNTHFRDYCAKYTRASQSEILGLGGTSWSINLVTGTLTWNTIASMSSIYSVYFDHFNGFQFGPITNAPRYYLLALHLVPIIFFTAGILSYRTVSESGGLLGLAVGLYAVLQGLIIFFEYAVKLKDHPYAIFKSIFYWMGYTINIMLVLVTANVLVQRRDVNFNIIYLTMGAMLGVIGLVSDYTTHVRIELGTAVEKITDSFKNIHRYLWITAAIIILGISNVSDSTFVNTPFSNAQSVLHIIVPILYIPIILLPSGWRPLVVPQYDDDANGVPTYSIAPAKKVFIGREMIDLVSRLIFTAAIFTDMASLGNRDNYYVAENPYNATFPIPEPAPA